ncbi:hypothetical protein GL279_00425 [Paracoccus limosus]|uniref:DNA transfer protein n=1 Tax=Paracoccus limosus TaxID=913252 RepID=A0A844H0R4_9RHOB|nr:hypothetical protein [Paracoccus limosus]MTH33063.1 hypothetical protein [Paracoccus limosus]
MPITAIAAVGSALIGASASKRAARSQERSAEAAAAVQKEIYDDTSKKFAPYLSAGNLGLEAYMSEMGLGPAPTIGGKPYGGFTETPGYQFQLQQGQDSINALAGAKGGLHSGATLKALSGYNQGLASQEYGNYLNRLSGLTNMGTSAAANQASAGQAYATNAGNALMAGGQAAAAGAINGANAITGGINNALGAWQYQRGLGGSDPLAGSLRQAGVSGVQNAGWW